VRKGNPDRRSRGGKIAFPGDRSYEARVSYERGAGAARTKLVHGVLLVLLGLAAAVIYTTPLARHFHEAIPYAYGVSWERRVQGLVPGDQLQFFYFLSLTDDMVHGRVPWFQDPYQFSAPDPSTRRNFFFLPFSLLFAAAAPLGRATAYNLLLWLSFPATALSTFLLAGRLGAGVLGSSLAATALTLLPYRVASLAGGHPTGVTFFLLPLTLYFLEAAWQDARRLAAAGAGLCLVCLSVNEPHFLYFFMFLLPLWLSFAVWRLEPTRRARGISATCAWLALAAVGPTAATAVHRVRHGAVAWTLTDLLLLFAVVWGTLALAWRISAEVRARVGDEAWESEARSYTPLLLLGAYAVQLVADVPHLGLAVCATTVAALLVCKGAAFRAAVALARRPLYRAAVSRLTRLWPAAAGLLAAAAFLLQYKLSFIDPSGQGGGRSLREIDLFAPHAIDFFRRSRGVLTREIYPGGVVAVLALAGLSTREGRALVLVAALFAVLVLGPNAPPWLPLYGAALHVIPFFSIIRQPAKLFAVTAVALALAAGLGATALSRRIGRFGRAALGFAGLAAIFSDFSGVLPLGVSRLPADNTAYREITARGAGSNLLELPLWPGDSAFSSIYQYWATRTRVATVNGYSPTVPRDYVGRVYRPLESMNVGELGEEQNRLLDDLRVRLVTLHRDAYPPKVGLYPYRFALASMRRNPNLRPVAVDDGVCLFERVPAPYRAWDQTVPWPMGVMFEAESLVLGAGARVADEHASGGMIVRGRTGDDLPVVYGPYRPMPRGRYEVRFRVRGHGRVEVSADLGRVELASARVNAADWREVPLGPVVDRSRTVEFRVWGDGGAVTGPDVDWVLVTKRDGEMEASAVHRFEAEDLTALYGTDEESSQASGGAYAILEYAPGFARDGPYRAFGPGRIEVAVRSRGGPFDLRVESADGRYRFASLRVARKASWGMEVVPVTLAERQILCTRLVASDERSDVDYVEITEPSPPLP
jgi:hypothetical protein